MTPGDIFTGIGFSVNVDYGGGSLLGYSIRLAIYFQEIQQEPLLL